MQNQRRERAHKEDDVSSLYKGLGWNKKGGGKRSGGGEKKNPKGERKFGGGNEDRREDGEETRAGHQISSALYHQFFFNYFLINLVMSFNTLLCSLISIME